MIPRARAALTFSAEPHSNTHARREQENSAGFLHAAAPAWLHTLSKTFWNIVFCALPITCLYIQQLLTFISFAVQCVLSFSVSSVSKAFNFKLRFAFRWYTIYLFGAAECKGG